MAIGFCAVIIECAGIAGCHLWELVVHIVACVKQTPDSAAQISVADGRVGWGDSPMVVNPWDEYAIEEAIRLKEKHGGRATAITMGPERARDALKSCIAMGCDGGVLVADAALAGSDARATARVLAAAIQKLGDVDVVIFGKQAIDGDSGIVPLAVARLLGWSPLSYVAQISALDAGARTIQVARLLEEGRQLCSAQLPVVISVVKDINEPRYPTFAGIRRAGSAQIPIWNLGDLGLNQLQVGSAAATVAWQAVRAPAARAGAVEILAGDSLGKTVAMLADRLQTEKLA